MPPEPENGFPQLLRLPHPTQRHPPCGWEVLRLPVTVKVLLRNRFVRIYMCTHVCRYVCMRVCMFLQHFKAGKLEDDLVVLAWTSTSITDY